MTASGAHDESAAGLSLVIPCEARDAILVELALRSVNEQTVLPGEVVLALSGVREEDARAWEATWRARLDARVSLAVSATSQPAFAGPNRQRGAAAARGDVISWFDVDDVQSPRRLERIWAAFGDPRVLAVYHRFRMHGQRHYPEVDRDAWLKGAVQMYHRGWVSVRARVARALQWSATARAQDFNYLQQVVERYPPECVRLLPDFLGTYLGTVRRIEEQVALMKRYLEQEGL